MSLKKALLEGAVWSLSKLQGGSHTKPPQNPLSIFVLRNNGLGDLIVITPLFEALKKTFPHTQIIAGVGSWSEAILQNNPFVDHVLTINAPWHNPQTAKHSPNTLCGLWDSLCYIYTSKEVDALKSLQCSIGIDVLGSPQGSLLFLKAKIPYRMGIRGYAGGHSATQDCLRFDPTVHVGAFSLQFAKHLGCHNLPENKPQIYLTSQEVSKAKHLWGAQGADKRKILVAPGGGYRSKCWPIGHYVELTRELAQDKNNILFIIGGAQEDDLAKNICQHAPNAHNLCGQASLRDTFAITSQSDVVLCNSSMLMHVGAAFSKKTLVLLGDEFSSASKHASLWGYPHSSRILGKDTDHPYIYSPKEVLTQIENL